MTELTKYASALASDFEDINKRLTVLESLAPGATWMDKVKAFHVLYDAPIHNEPTEGLPQMDDARLDLRVGLIEEEFNELKEATKVRDIIEMADALGDIIYVVCGFAIEAGIDLNAVVQEIQASNMTKLGADGNPVRREDGKILKGPNYRKPNIRAVLGL